MKYVKPMWWYKEILLKHFIRLGKNGDTSHSHMKILNMVKFYSLYNNMQISSGPNQNGLFFFNWTTDSTVYL